MASLLSPRRSDDQAPTSVSLHASESTRPSEPDGSEIDPISWPVAAVLGGLTSAAAGWILVSGLVVCGWLLTDTGTLHSALELGTRLWLLANGVSVTVSSLPVTLVPWGLTAVLAFMVWRFGAYAGRRIPPGSDVGAVSVAAVVTGTCGFPVLGVAVFFAEPWRAPLHWAAVLVVLFVAALVGAADGSRTSLTGGWPRWLRGLPRAVMGAQLVLLAAGAAVLTVGLVTGWSRVETLTRALDPGTAGGVLLVLAQASLLPNALAWSGSYALGAGFSLGNGSVVAPAATQLGVLPGIPVLGALPTAGPGGTEQLWWLAAGALAGATAAWLVLRGGVGARFDQTALLGGLAGALSGVLFVGLAWATSGDLGTVRLTGLGPRLLPLLVMATTTLGLSGMVTGASIGLLRRRPARDAEPAEETVPVAQ